MKLNNFETLAEPNLKMIFVRKAMKLNNFVTPKFKNDF